MELRERPRHGGVKRGPFRGGRRTDEPHRRGELIVFDKLSRPLVSHIILPVPTEKTKGVLIAPTVFGNVMLGPTADDTPDKTATSGAEGLWVDRHGVIYGAQVGQRAVVRYTQTSKSRHGRA